MDNTQITRKRRSIACLDIVSAREEPQWPGHPQPIPGESMESWMMRQAFANGLSPGQFVYVYFKRVWHRFDWDSPLEPGILRQVAAIAGGHEGCPPMSLSPGLTPYGRQTKENVICKEDRDKNGSSYCPVCFSEDNIPHLRLFWRYTFAQVCIKHSVLLESKCGKCGEPFNPWKAKPDSTLISNCVNCGNSVSETSTTQVKHAESNYIAAKKMLDLVSGEIVPSDLGWKVSLAEFFEITGFLLLFLRARHWKSRNSAERSIWTGNGRRFPAEAALVSGLWGELWELITNSARMKSIIRENQRLFNDYARWRGCPKPLLQYRRSVLHQYDWSHAERVAEEMRNRGEKVSRRRISTITGIPYNLVSRKDAQLQPTLQESRLRYRPGDLERYVRNLQRIVDEMPVSFPIEKNHLAESIGTTSSTLNHNVRFAEVVRHYKELSKQYLGQFACPYVAETRRGQTGAHHVSFLKRPGWHKLRQTPRIWFMCRTCRKSFTVKLEAEAIPTYRQFSYTLHRKT